MKYDVEFFDVKKGTPSVTVAEYGLTLNAAASDTLVSSEHARIGLDRKRKLIIVQPLSTGQEMPEAFSLKRRGDNHPTIRINSRDFMRFVAMNTGISLRPAMRCLAEWDVEAGCLVIDLGKAMEATKRPSNSARHTQTRT